MKNYNYTWINLNYKLIEIFLFEADPNILDVSYQYSNKNLLIQIVMMEGQSLSKEKLGLLEKSLPEYEITIQTIFLSKAQFLEFPGNWEPTYYSWLEHLLFSKSNIQ